jgi:hypothetical protein
VFPLTSRLIISKLASFPHLFFEDALRVIGQARFMPIHNDELKPPILWRAGSIKVF